MKVYGRIYRIKNILNDKSYVGQTTRSLSKRFNEHKTVAYKEGYSCSPKLENAIKKYGKQNYTIELLEEANDQKELDNREEFWINSLKTVGGGYNIESKCRGRGRVSDETKKKISLGNKGKVVSEETKKKLREAAKKRLRDKKNHPNFNKPVLEETRKKIIKGNIKATGRGIVQFDKKGRFVNTFESISSACNKLGLKDSSIIRCCKKKQKTSGNFQWSYLSDWDGKKISPIIKVINKKRRKTIKNKKVICLNSKKIYSSDKQISLELNIPIREIRRVLRKDRNTTKGLSFEYV